MRFLIFPALLLLLNFRALAQGGVNAPGKYATKEFLAGDCFVKSRYKPAFSGDSLKANQVIHGQRIWRVVGLEDRENRLMLTTNKGCTQVGLFEVIKFGMLDNELNVFESDDFNDVAKSRLSMPKKLERLRFRDSSEVVTFDADGNEKKEIVVGNRYYQGPDVQCYLLKEDWIMNANSGETKKYIVAIAPLIFDPKLQKVVPLFWLYYPEWKSFFSCFMTQTAYDDEPLSYAEIFAKRRFFSTVTKESNVFDRSVRATHHGDDIQLHTEEIKDKLNKGESDHFGH